MKEKIIIALIALAVFMPAKPAAAPKRERIEAHPISAATAEPTSAITAGTVEEISETTATIKTETGTLYQIPAEDWDTGDAVTILFNEGQPVRFFYGVRTLAECERLAK